MAWTLVNHIQTGSTNGGVSVTTTAINTTGADLLLLTVAYYSTLPTTLSDSYSNTWSLISNQSPGGQSAAFYRASGSPTVGTGHTFTASGGTTYPNLAIMAWSGSAASPLDQFNGSSGTSTPPGSITPTVANELVCLASGTGATFGTTPSGYTLVDTASQASGQSIGVGTCYQIQTAATATNPTWTNSQGIIIASFKMASGVAPSTIQYRTLMGVGI